MTQQPRSVTIGLSGEWLDEIGIPDWIDENALAEIIEMVVKESMDIVREEWESWKNDHLVDERDRYGTEEHEAWLIEMERQEG